MRYPNITKNEKNRISYCFWSFILGGIIGPLDFLPKYGLEFYPLGYFCVPFLITPIGIAIYKHNLMNIKIVIKKGMVYSILIATITGIYLLLIMIIEHIFRGMIGYRSIIVSLLSAFIIAIIFNPLRDRIHNFIDKIFLGKLPQEIAIENKLLKQELEHSERLKTASTLALSLAHEVKNPLTTLKTFTEFLPDHYEDKEFLQKFSKIVPGEIERVNDIIKQLLQFSKPSPPAFQTISIYQLMQDILIFLNNDFLKHKIKLNEYYEDRNLKINADPSQIKQAMLNILLNAIDAMPNGGTITIEVKKRENLIELSIRDSGCGIAKEDLKHIFDPFFSKKESGTGLGLAVTHQIIKNHNGKIEVESELNKSTAFSIIIPLIKNPSENAS
jgi:signal transduction histidine kinase